MNLEVADIIDAAADLIEPEGRWCQHAMARTRGGLPVLPRHQQAYCWCPGERLDGIEKVVGSIPTNSTQGALAQ